MSDATALPGFEDQVSVADEARRAIYRVRDAYQADLDRLEHRLSEGGTRIEMRPVVDAAWLLTEIIRELAKAAGRVGEVNDE